MTINKKGFSLAEMLVGLAISVIAVVVVVSFQSNVAKYAVRMQRKAEALEFENELSRAFGNLDVCTCNTRGLSVVADPDRSATAGETLLKADFPSSLPLSKTTVGTPHYKTDGTLNCDAPAADQAIAQAGQPLKGTRFKTTIRAISVINLKPTGNPSLVGEEYTGNLEVSFDPPAGADPTLNTTMQPARTAARFYVKNNQIYGCGIKPNEITVSQMGAITNNDRLEYDESKATCPQGTLLLGGGWLSYVYAGPKKYQDVNIDKQRGCLRPNPLKDPNLPSAYYLTVLAAYPSKVDNSYHVIAQCHEVAAIALCYKPNILIQ